MRSFSGYSVYDLNGSRNKKRTVQLEVQQGHNLSTTVTPLQHFKVIGIRPMAPVLNTGPPEGI